MTWFIDVASKAIVGVAVTPHQPARGAVLAAAAYCLYLHHVALGEKDAAGWWHQQTDDVHDPDQPPQPTEPTAPSWHTADRQITNASLTITMLRLLRDLAKYTTRPQSAAVTELMAYIPTAVAASYLRQSEMDLPMPGPDFAHRSSTLLGIAADRPTIPGRLPARRPLRTRPVARDTPRSTPGPHSTDPGTASALTDQRGR
ncbi:hypothetical protein [Streptomyces sp. NPDC056707]|uniref:hypothetical protein n=1 Tax=Streptomyces sp. NPDC056707 TaxID=3345919 RepID=UPI0036CC47A3